MKKLFLTLIALVMATGMALADDRQDQGYFINAKNTGSGVSQKGCLPPRWLLNKVTPAQYDTLVALNRLCNVDYSMLKGYHVTAKDVPHLMEQARKMLARALENPNGSTAAVGWTVIIMKRAKPVADVTEKGVRRLTYIIYSSVDGYDAHLQLRGTVRKDRKSGKLYLVDYEVTPYSVQGIPAKADGVTIKGNGNVNMDELLINEDVKTIGYALNGTLSFTDPLGDVHKEQVNASVSLGLDQ